MKKYLLGLAAIVIAAASVAFTTPDSKNVNSYWFVAADSETDITLVDLVFPSTPPVLQSSNPFSCATGTRFCSLPFPAIKLDGGVYKPSINGSQVIAPADYEEHLNDDPAKKSN